MEREPLIEKRKRKERIMSSAPINAPVQRPPSTADGIRDFKRDLVACIINWKRSGNVETNTINPSSTIEENPDS